MKLPEYIIIRVKRPADYDDVHAELVAQDFLDTHDSNEWEFEIRDDESARTTDTEGES